MLQILLVTPSILVLPFRGIGDNANDDYFSDGLAADITTDLSKSSKLLVIANQTALSFKGEETNAQDVGRELGVDYILDGSLRRGGSDLRVNAQLIDVRTGLSLWAERYDRNLDKQVCQSRRYRISHERNFSVLCKYRHAVSPEGSESDHPRQPA